MKPGWEYLKYDQSRQSPSLLYKAIVYLLVFIIAILGVPLPMPVQVSRHFEAIKDVQDIIETEEAEATQVKRVQHNFSDISYTDEFETETLPYAVDTNNAMVLLSVESDNILVPGGKGGVMYAEGPRLVFYRIVFESSTSYLVQRYAANYDTTATGYCDVQSHVIDFIEGANIYAGETIFEGGTLTKNKTLPADVELAKTFVLYNRLSRFKTPNENEAMYFKLTLTPKDAPDDDKADELKVERQCVLTAQDNDLSLPTVTLNYYVIEFTTDVTVHSSTTQIAATSASQVVDVSSYITSSDLGQTFLIFNYTGNNTIDGLTENLFTRGKLWDDAGTPKITFTRNTAGSTGDTIDISWYLVQFTDESSNVQRNTATVSGATTTAALSPGVDLTRSFPTVSYTGTATGVLAHDDIFTRADLTTTTNLLLDRSLGTQLGTVTAEWQVVEFSPVTVKYPNGDETLVVGDEAVITWKCADSLISGNVKIDYYDGDGWQEIVSSTSASALKYTWEEIGKSDGSSLWNILPDNEVTTNCKVRICNVSKPLNSDLQYDVSNTGFTIKSKLEITAHNGGTPIWYVSDTENITWNYRGNFDGTTDAIKLEYSVDGAHVTWTDVPGATSLSEGTSGTGSFEWGSLPIAASGKTTKVRAISNYNSGTVVDDSDADFEIRGKINILTPTPSTEWYTGNTEDITWTLDSNTTTVSIYYSTDGGNSYFLCDDPGSSGYDAEAGDADPYEGAYPWNIPLTASSTLAKIRIEDDHDSDIFTATNTFTIYASIVMKTPPIMNDVWKVGENKSINFTINPPGTTTLDIFYTKNFSGSPVWTLLNNGNDVGPFATGDHSHNWTVQDIISNDVGFKILDINSGGKIYDTGPDNGASPGPMRVKGRVRITTPATDGSSVFNANSNNSIVFAVDGDVTNKHGNLDFYYWDGTQWNEIYTNIDTVTEAPDMAWNSVDIPTGHLNFDDNKVKFEHPSDSDVGGESATFILHGEISGVTIDQGASGIYNIGDTCTITWTPYPATGLGNVDIRYTLNGGVDNYPASQSVATAENADDGTFDWSLDSGSLVSTNVKVKVFLANDITAVSESWGNVSDDSPAFKIKGSLSVTAPTTGAAWEAGTTQQVNWNYEGDLGPIKISYDIGDGSGFVHNIENSGTWDVGTKPYNWFVPVDDAANIFKGADDGLNNDIRIKVEDADDDAVYGISDTITFQCRFVNF
ncbi:MAG: hypothetical protein ABH843_05365, partial [Candidatus Omnitrophota bacterium]